MSFEDCVNILLVIRHYFLNSYTLKKIAKIISKLEEIIKFVFLSIAYVYSQIL